MPAQTPPCDIDTPTSDALRAEATRLLDAGLAAIVSRYGELHVMGSCALNLMTWRDLDLHVVPPSLNVATFFRFGGELAQLLQPHRAHFRDETAGSDPALPRGLYWGLYLHDERHGAWKIDIWWSDRSGLDNSTRFLEHVASRLNPETREAILQIKRACWRHPEYRRAFTSADVYSAVLDRGVRDVATFWRDLKMTRDIDAPHNA